MKIGSDVIMKIEKLSDKQIRCILDKSDLADRHLKISELAYGTEKAKELFREMMRQASYEFGFDADNIPLMIEAIPVSSECVVLVVTKVDDPEELDTRFSKVTPDDDYDFDDFNDEITEEIDCDTPSEYMGFAASDALPDNNGADDVISLFNKVKEYLNKNVVPVDSEKQTPPFIPLNQSLPNISSPSQSQELSRNAFTDDSTDEKENIRLVRIFSFDNIDVISDAAKIVSGIYSDNNSLYKDNNTGRYYLVLEKGNCSPSSFNKVCNIFTEFGKREHPGYGGSEFLSEHYDLLIRNNAIQSLSTI